MGCSGSTSTEVKDNENKNKEIVKMEKIEENKIKKEEESMIKENEKKEENIIEENKIKEEESMIKENEKKEENIIEDKKIKKIEENKNIKKQCIIGSPNLVPDEIVNILRECVARIEIKNENKIFTGFFIKMHLKKSIYKFLLTCNHSIPQQTIDSKIKIAIYYGLKNEEIKKKIELDTEQRFIKTYEELDVTVIEIKEEDGISEYRYLSPDLNYKNGLQHYLNAEVYTAGYPNVQIHKKDKHYSAGKIRSINEEDFIFGHTCDTKEGSSGCPIINYDRLVIGIHFGGDIENKINYATFIYKIIDELLLEEKNINPLMNDNSMDKEDEKDNNFIKLNKNMMGLGLNYIGEMLNNQAAMNMAYGFMKDPTFIKLFLEKQNDPKLKGLVYPPEILKKFMGKDNNFDIEGLMKFNMECYKTILNDPNMLQNMLNNPQENYNKFWALNQLEKDNLSEDIESKDEKKSDAENEYEPDEP